MRSFINKKPIWLVIISAALILMSALSWADDNRIPARILVSGQGSVDIAPDMALLTLTVASEAKTARAALDENNSAMKKVMDSMQADDIEARDLQTSDFNIQPRYVYPPVKPNGERPAPEVVAYIVRNTLTVRVRDLSDLGRVLDTSVSLGVNEGGNITFTNADPTAAITQARINAVTDAMNKAKTLASAAGVRVGKILELSEQTFNPRPMPMARAEMSLRSSADAVPVAAGENTYKVTINVSYEIDQ